MKMIDFLIALSSLVSTRQIILFTKAVELSACGDDRPGIHSQHLNGRRLVVFLERFIYHLFDYLYFKATNINNLPLLS